MEDGYGCWARLAGLGIRFRLHPLLCWGKDYSGWRTGTDAGLGIRFRLHPLSCWAKTTADGGRERMLGQLGWASVFVCIRCCVGVKTTTDLERNG